MKAAWKMTKLGDIADIQSGGTPLVSNTAFWGGGIAWYSSGELNKIFTADPERTVSAAGIAGSNAKLFPTGSLLIGMYDTAALKMSILDRDAAFNQAIAGVKPNSTISMRFVFYALNAIKKELLEQRRGVRQKNLSLSKVKNFPIPQLPLSEQQRIVAILDEAFDGIATAKANAEKNLQNAREVVDVLSEELFKGSSDLGPNDLTLADLSEAIVDCEHKTAPTQEEGIPSIRTPNIGAGQLLLDGVYRVSEETYTEWTRRAEPRPGDLILAREAPAGNVAVIPEGERVCLGQRTVLIRPKSSVFDSTYLAHLLLCASSQKRLLAHSRGATVQHINMKDIRAFKVHVVPPLDEQHRIVRNLSALIEQGDLLVKTQSRKLAALEELKKSLLHQAFSGEL